MLPLRQLRIVFQWLSAEGLNPITGISAREAEGPHNVAADPTPPEHQKESFRVLLSDLGSHSVLSSIICLLEVSC